MENITAIRYYKNNGEFVITTRNSITGDTTKTYANHLKENEQAWAKNSKHFFESESCACWMN